MTGERVYLDFPPLRERLHRVYPQSGYTKRKVPSPQPRVIEDVVPFHYQPEQAPKEQGPVKPPARAEISPIQFVLAREVELEQPPEHKRNISLEPDKAEITPVSKLAAKQFKKFLVPTIAILLILSGSYVSYTGWQATKDAKNQASQLTTQANQAFQSGTQPLTSTVRTAKKSTAPVLSTVKPSYRAVATYTVGPQYPKYLKIPKLSVYARVLSVGTTSTGALGTPDNVFDTAWYAKSALPGQPGAMLIDGHVSSWTTHGVFYGLKQLAAGDSIQVIRGDGKTFNYRVVKTQIFNSNKVNMTAAVSPINPNDPGLNLITCTGDVIPGTSQFNQRIIVFAQQV